MQCGDEQQPVQANKQAPHQAQSNRWLLISISLWLQFRSVRNGPTPSFGKFLALVIIGRVGFIMDEEERRKSRKVDFAP